MILIMNTSPADHDHDHQHHHQRWMNHDACLAALALRCCCLRHHSRSQLITQWGNGEAWSQSSFKFRFSFCDVSSSWRVQMGPKWPQMIKIMSYWSFWIILDPRRPLWDISNPAMFGHFWPKKGFFGPPCAHDWRMARAKTASNQLPICQKIPKVSIYGLNNKKSDRKGLKIAKKGKILAQKWHRR